MTFLLVPIRIDAVNYDFGGTRILQVPSIAFEDLNSHAKDQEVGEQPSHS